MQVENKSSHKGCFPSGVYAIYSQVRMCSPSFSSEHHTSYPAAHLVSPQGRLNGIQNVMSKTWTLHPCHPWLPSTPPLVKPALPSVFPSLQKQHHHLPSYLGQKESSLFSASPPIIHFSPPPWLLLAQPPSTLVWAILEPLNQSPCFHTQSSASAHHAAVRMTTLQTQGQNIPLLHSALCCFQVT